MTSEQTKELKDAASKFLVALSLPNGQQTIRPAKILNLYNENIAEMEITTEDDKTLTLYLPCTNINFITNM